MFGSISACLSAWYRRLNASNCSWIKQSAETVAEGGARIVFLWGKPQKAQLSGSLIKLPAGFKGSLHSHGSTFRAVVIEGQAGYQTSGESAAKSLMPGSYFGGKGESVHRISSTTSGESTIYIHTDGN